MARSHLLQSFPALIWLIPIPVLRVDYHFFTKIKSLRLLLQVICILCGFVATNIAPVKALDILTRTSHYKWSEDGIMDGAALQPFSS